ncbi:hypothetical protein [Fangia hongkongensis]|uniref:hypothetical protein n=1 Tax=Fangia hongkongensis TaxID=270495 RepID=UPI00036DC658|nr:hypothetical protein [Fangia hongkongensis]MBK2124841.1 hypothetical protein [Fangia hongkongensis]
MPKKQTQKRKKNGKVKGWEAHMMCRFTKEGDANTYVERCAIKVGVASLSAVKGNPEVYAAVDSWIDELVESNGYEKGFTLSVERWVAIR